MASISRVTVILNPCSGPKRVGEPSATVRTALETAGVRHINILALKPGLNLEAEIGQRIREGTDAVVAVGGDGTVSSVASALVDTNTPLGVLPAGTLNHFARDLAIPSNLGEAAHLIAAGNTVRVDVGKVNGRFFVNNSSIGIYPAMVNMRESLMQKGLSKRLAMPLGVIAAVWHFPNTAIRLQTDNTGIITRTPFVFIGNNNYELSGFEAGVRKALSDGVLQVCTVQNPSRITLLRTLVSALAGHASTAPELHLDTAQEVRVATLRKRVPVALDGEVLVMKSPLVYTVCPAVLKVLAPAPQS